MSEADVEIDLANGQHVVLGMKTIDEEMLANLWGWLTNVTSMRYTTQDGTRVVRRRPFAVTGDLKVSGTTNWGRGEPSTPGENPIRATAEGLGIPPVPDRSAVPTPPEQWDDRQLIAVRDMLPGDDVLGVGIIKSVRHVAGRKYAQVQFSFRVSAGAPLEEFVDPDRQMFVVRPAPAPAAPPAPTPPTRMVVAARDLLPGDNVVGVAIVEEVIMGLDSRARDVARIRFLTDVNDDPSDDPRVARYPAETTFEIERFNSDSPAPY